MTKNLIKGTLEILLHYLDYIIDTVEFFIFFLNNFRSSLESRRNTNNDYLMRKNSVPQLARIAQFITHFVFVFVSLY